MDPTTAMVLIQAVKAVAEYAAAAKRSNEEALQHIGEVMAVFDSLPAKATRIPE